MDIEPIVQKIIDTSPGADLVEMKSRSKALAAGLRKIRMLERQLEQDGDTEALHRAWNILCTGANRLADKHWKFSPSPDGIRAELNEIPLAEPPEHVYEQIREDDRDKCFGWYHHCRLNMPDGEVVDLGTFYVRLDHRYHSPRVYAHKNCYDYHSSHPHVASGGSMCMGDAEMLYRRLRDTNDWAAMYDVVCATLDTFNPSSPYWRIDSMRRDSEACRVCGTPDTMDLMPDPMWDPNGPYRQRLICEVCLDRERRRAFRDALREASREHNNQVRRRRYDNPQD